MVFVDSTSFAQPEYTLTEYFAKSCGHCKALAPVWEKAHEEAINMNNASNVNWVQKECYADNWAPGKDHAYCQEKGISAFPTILLEKTSTGQEWLAPPLTGSTQAEKAEQLNQFVAQHTGDSVKVSSLGLDQTILTNLGRKCSRYAMYSNFL